MEVLNKIKAIIVSIASGFMSLLGILAIPVLIMVGCNVIDYATGVIAAKYRNQKVDSYKGFRGILKKVCMWLLVVVGAIVDWLLQYASSTIGITLPFTFLIACIVAIWIICNELLSILENITDIGTPLPLFLKNVVKYIKKQTEGKANFDMDKEGDTNE
ncbi:phage holin family protein [Lachnoclostridium sp.]|uniref:phage holin family protein n=1 Tax=Lachnoclostridium sp. TaxID=2028282 RepID=UPI0028976393|nr:phage holin family protein [Lachnoclostridium sp.]